MLVDGRSANVGEYSLNAFGVKDDCITMVMPLSNYIIIFSSVTLRHEVLYTIAVLNHFIFFPTFLAFKN